MTATCTTTYHKGPLGWGVLRNGSPVGIIKRIPALRVYLVEVDGLRPGDGKPAGSYTFKTLAAAKRAVCSKEPRT